MRNRRKIMFQYKQAKNTPVVVKIFKHACLALDFYITMEKQEKQSLTIFVINIDKNLKREYLIITYDMLLELSGSGNKSKAFIGKKRNINGKKTND